MAPASDFWGRAAPRPPANARYRARTNLISQPAPPTIAASPLYTRQTHALPCAGSRATRASTRYARDSLGEFCVERLWAAGGLLAMFACYARPVPLAHCTSLTALVRIQARDSTPADNSWPGLRSGQYARTHVRARERCSRAAQNCRLASNLAPGLSPGATQEVPRRGPGWCPGRTLARESTPVGNSWSNRRPDQRVPALAETRKRRPRAAQNCRLASILWPGPRPGHRSGPHRGRWLNPFRPTR